MESDDGNVNGGEASKNLRSSALVVPLASGLLGILFLVLQGSFAESNYFSVIGSGFVVASVLGFVVLGVIRLRSIFKFPKAGLRSGLSALGKEGKYWLPLFCLLLGLLILIFFHRSFTESKWLDAIGIVLMIAGIIGFQVPTVGEWQLIHWKRYWFLLFCFLLGLLILVEKHEMMQSHWLASADSNIADFVDRLRGRSGVKHTTADENHPANRILTDLLVGEIGIAFVVASLIGFFVEHTLRKEEEKRHIEQEKAIELNVFGAILSSFAPRWITRDLIDVFKVKAMRSNVTTSYTFRPAPREIGEIQLGKMKIASDELLQLDFQLEYELENVTTSELDPEIKHGFEPTVPTCEKWCDFTSLKITPIGTNDPKIEWKANDSNPASVKREKKSWNEITVSVRNFSLEPRERVKVTMAYTCIRWLRDHDTWTTRLASDKLTIKASDCSQAKLDFKLFSTRGREFRGPVSENLAKVWESGDQELTNASSEAKCPEKPGGVLPYQGFTLHWYPAATSADNQ